MSTFNTRDEDDQARIARQRFEYLQANVVNCRRVVNSLRETVVYNLGRYSDAKKHLKKNEAELKRLHDILHPDDNNL